MASHQLILIRHSKAADGPDDSLRSLSERGRRDAASIGTWLHGLSLKPNLAVTSNARRAAETWDLAAAAFDEAPPVISDRRIYDNTPESLLEVIAETGIGVATLAVIGHNPSIGTLALNLDGGQGDVAARASLARGYPTSAVAVFAIDGALADIRDASARLTHFATPAG
jgi:phosphohistidine phosphatase